MATTDTPREIAAAAARLVVQEGMDYGAAKRHALKLLGLAPRTPLPGNDVLEEEVREYIAIFCAETQPRELGALRELALTWMQRLHAFRPHVSGAVWHGTATRLTDIYLQLFCDDSKSAEIELIDKGVHYTVSSVTGIHGDTVDALSLRSRCEPLQETVGVHLMIYDLDDLRGALQPDSQGRSPRGSVAAFCALLDKNPEIPS